MIILITGASHSYFSQTLKAYMSDTKLPGGSTLLQYVDY